MPQSFPSVLPKGGVSAGRLPAGGAGAVAVASGGATAAEATAINSVLRNVNPGSRISQLLGFPLDEAVARPPEAQRCLDALLCVLRTGEQAELEQGLEQLRQAVGAKGEGD